MKIWKIILWISAAGIIIPPLVGVAGTVSGMIKAVDSSAMSGESDPEVLAERISLSIMATAGGLVISLLFIPLLVIALVMIHRTRNRRQLSDPEQ